MFFGEFEHTIDSKGRLTIPAKFKDELAGGLVVTRGLDHCLWAYTREEWKLVSEKIASLPMASAEARRFTRFMFAGASEAIPDRQGRIIIPQKLLEHAGIDKDVVVTGMMNRIEIWSPERWQEEQGQATENPEALVAQLANLGIL
jgi:MraZ protein